MVPLCFVLMPFGKKVIPSGTSVDFNAVYDDLIAPAIIKAGMEPLRADEEVVGGIIHKPMFERLILCDFAVADLTGANANVFYELGVRHGIRPATTVLLFAGTERMPFDVAPLRAMPYQLGPDGKLVDIETARKGLHKLLEAARDFQGDPSVDSPLFQLLDGYNATILLDELQTGKLVLDIDGNEQLAPRLPDTTIGFNAFFNQVGVISARIVCPCVDLSGFACRSGLESTALFSYFLAGLP